MEKFTYEDLGAKVSFYENLISESQECIDKLRKEMNKRIIEKRLITVPTEIFIDWNVMESGWKVYSENVIDDYNLCKRCKNAMEYANTEKDFFSHRNGDWKIYRYADYDNLIEMFCCGDHFDDFEFGKTQDELPEKVRVDPHAYPKCVRKILEAAMIIDELNYVI